MKLAPALCIVALLAAFGSATGDTVLSFYDLTANTLDGTSKKLSDYKGKVLVVVNTASQCGYTPQPAGGDVSMLDRLPVDASYQEVLGIKRSYTAMV